MGADTALKRYSAMNIGSPWRGLNAVPDVAIPQGEQQAIAFFYSGILWGEPIPPIPVVDTRHGGDKRTKKPYRAITNQPLRGQKPQHVAMEALEEITRTAGKPIGVVIPEGVRRAVASKPSRSVMDDPAVQARLKALQERMWQEKQDEQDLFRLGAFD